MGIVVDTGVFITVERQGRPWREVLLGETRGELLTIAAITASELLAGVHRADTDERRLSREARVEEILSTVETLPFDLAVARVHAQLWANLVTSGQVIGPYDCMIAATAVAYGYSILTENVREFARIPGLVIRQPAW
jgi:predicted nucleic acid-binding protein